MMMLMEEGDEGRGRPLSSNEEKIICVYIYPPGCL